MSDENTNTSKVAEDTPQEKILFILLNSTRDELHRVRVLLDILIADIYGLQAESLAELQKLLVEKLMEKVGKEEVEE